MYLQNFLKENYSENNIQYRINIFDKVRDFVYQINGANTIEKLLDIKEGYCVPKARLLKVCYEKLGYETKLCFIPFSFSFIELPSNLKNWGYFDKPGYHVFLKLRINDNWIDIDSTWNKELNEIFGSNLNWDGFSSQKVVSNYDEYFIPKDDADEISIKEKLSNNYKFTEDDFSWIKEFNTYVKTLSNQ